MTRLYDQNMDLREQLKQHTKQHKELQEKYKVLDINHMEKDFTLKKMEKGGMTRPAGNHRIPHSEKGRPGTANRRTRSRAPKDPRGGTRRASKAPIGNGRVGKSTEKGPGTDNHAQQKTDG